MTVRIGPSTIDGQGLFAAANLRGGTTVADYRDAEIISREEAVRRVSLGNAFVAGPLRDGTFRDGLGCLCGTLNAPRRGVAPNCKLLSTGRIVVVAGRARPRNATVVRAGAELTMAYGRAYWTRRKKH